MAQKAERAIPIDAAAYPVHPAAELIPMMSPAEVEELAEDIRQNGMHQPIALWRDTTAMAKANAPEPYFRLPLEKQPPIYQLDGRARLAALKLLGVSEFTVAELKPFLGKEFDGSPERAIQTLDAYRWGATLGSTRKNASDWRPVVPDPYDYVMSANVHRRQLSAAEKADAIRAYRERNPHASNRKIARTFKVSPPTVATITNSQNVKTLQNANPAERAKAELLTDPHRTNVAIAALIEVAESTVRKTRKELEADGTIPPKGKVSNVIPLKAKPMIRRPTARQALAADKHIDRAFTRIKTAIAKASEKLSPEEASTLRSLIRDYVS